MYNFSEAVTPSPSSSPKWHTSDEHCCCCLPCIYSLAPNPIVCTLYIERNNVQAAWWGVTCAHWDHFPVFPEHCLFLVQYSCNLLIFLVTILLISRPYPEFPDGTRTIPVVSHNFSHFPRFLKNLLI